MDQPHFSDLYGKSMPIGGSQLLSVRPDLSLHQSAAEAAPLKLTDVSIMLLGHGAPRPANFIYVHLNRFGHQKIRPRYDLRLGPGTAARP